MNQGSLAGMMRVLAVCLLVPWAQAGCDFFLDIHALIDGDDGKAGECGAQIGTQHIDVTSVRDAAIVCQFSQLVRCITDPNQDCTHLHHDCRSVRSEMDVVGTRALGRTSAATGLWTREGLSKAEETEETTRASTRGWEMLETDSSYRKDNVRLNFWLTTALACFVAALVRTCRPRLKAIVDWWSTAPPKAAELARPERPECPLCFECFREDSTGARVPRILRCGHSACHGCYSHMLRRVQVETGREAKPLECPVCKDVTLVRHGKAGSLPKVYSLLR